MNLTPPPVMLHGKIVGHRLGQGIHQQLQAVVVIALRQVAQVLEGGRGKFLMGVELSGELSQLGQAIPPASHSTLDPGFPAVRGFLALQTREVGDQLTTPDLRAALDAAPQLGTGRGHGAEIRPAEGWAGGQDLLHDLGREGQDGARSGTFRAYFGTTGH